MANDRRLVTVDYLEERTATFANALKGTASGSAILIDDVSPVEHIMGVEVSSKNLIPYPYNIDTSTIPSSVTVTDNEDGSLTVNGSITGITGSSLVTFATVTLEAGTYTFSLSGEHGSTAFACYDLFGSAFISKNSPQTATITETKTVKLSIFIPGSYTEGAVVTIENAILIPQIEKGSTATAYTPYVSDLGNIVLRKQGKNLISNDTIISESASLITQKIWSGNLSAPFVFSQDTSQFTPKENYTNRATFKFVFKDGTEKYISYASNSLSFSAGTLKEIYFDNHCNGTGTIKCQLEIGTVMTDYEPYVGEEYTPNADGTVEGITSLYPNTTLTTDTDGVLIDCEYNRDINKAFAALEPLYSQLAELDSTTDELV